MLPLICGLENKTQVDLSVKQTDIESRFVVAKGEGRVREGRTGSLGLADANYDTENG